MARYRIDKINEEIKRDLSVIIRGLKDPRIPQMISIVGVRTTPDLRYCKVYVSCLDSEMNAQAVKGLTSAAGLIRREVGARMGLRYTPQFIFAGDTSISNGAHIIKMLNDIDRERKESSSEEGM